jgi:hypothetical protein
MCRANELRAFHSPVMFRLGTCSGCVGKKSEQLTQQHHASDRRCYAVGCSCGLNWVAGAWGTNQGCESMAGSMQQGELKGRGSAPCMRKRRVPKAKAAILGLLVPQ